MKLCKDCNWHREGRLFDHCYHPSAITSIDVVSGSNIHTTCQIMRANKCGLDAELFDPKLSLLQRFFTCAKPQ